MRKNYDDDYNELMQNSLDYRRKQIDRARELESIIRYGKLPMTPEMTQFNEIAKEKIENGKGKK